MSAILLLHQSSSTLPKTAAKFTQMFCVNSNKIGIVKPFPLLKINNLAM
jgi:hypothetical protein